MPGLKWTGKKVPLSWLFKLTEMNVAAADRFYPLAKRGHPLFQAFAGKADRDNLRRISKSSVVYTKWLRNLEHAWPNWADRSEGWISLEGEEYLIEALRRGKGAILISGHQYGFSRLVSPRLAQKGYTIIRTGYATIPHQVSRWGRRADINCRYVSYQGDYWHHIRVLRELGQALKSNEVVHMSIRGSPQGDPGLEIDFCYKRFFLDPVIFQAIEILQAPVLPCFAICEGWRVVIQIYPAIQPSTEKIMTIFGPLYARYLKESPEFSRIWRRVVLQWENW